MSHIRPTDHSGYAYASETAPNADVTYAYPANNRDTALLGTQILLDTPVDARSMVPDCLTVQNQQRYTTK
jgi:hypothetical protein